LLGYRATDETPVYPDPSAIEYLTRYVEVRDAVEANMRTTLNASTEGQDWVDSSSSLRLAIAADTARIALTRA
jgi:hypothetical protein